jgi:hypothetical protein
MKRDRAQKVKQMLFAIFQTLVPIVSTDPLRTLDSLDRHGCRNEHAPRLEQPPGHLPLTLT